jgi:hypothetical protein
VITVIVAVVLLLLVITVIVAVVLLLVITVIVAVVLLLKCGYSYCSRCFVVEM